MSEVLEGSETQFNSKMLETHTSHRDRNNEGPSSRIPSVTRALPSSRFRQITPIIHEYIYDRSVNCNLTDPVFENKEGSPQAEPLSTTPPLRAQSPTAIVLFGWANAPLHSIERFAKGHVAQFSTSRIFIVLCTLKTLFFQKDQDARQSMMPLVWELSGDIIEAQRRSEKSAGLKGEETTEELPRIIIHAMSNGGLISLRALSMAWLETFLQPLPHTLFILDSCPGSGVWRNELIRWGAAAVAPIVYGGNPIVSAVPGTKALLTAAGTLSVAALAVIPEEVTGNENLVALSRKCANDPRLLDPRAARIYFYSPADEAMMWQDIESSIQDARSSQYWEGGILGFKLEGSRHVMHEKIHRELYWRMVRKGWDKMMRGESIENFSSRL